MSYATIPTAADATSADFGKPPTPPHRSTWMLAVIAVLVGRFLLLDVEEPDALTVLLFICLIVYGLLDVIAWAVRVARFAAARGSLRGILPLG